MDFNLTDEQELIVASYRDYMESENWETYFHECDEKHEYPLRWAQGLCEMGFDRIMLDEEHGGLGLEQPITTLMAIYEVLGQYGAPTYVLYLLTGYNTIVREGTQEQIDACLKYLGTGEQVVNSACTEPGAGSDASSMVTTAVKDGDDYILNGRKCFISGAPLADYCIVYAKTDMSRGNKGISAFIVDMKAPGVSCGKHEAKMGLVGYATSDVVLEDVRVNKSDMLGKENMGFINAMKTLDGGRLGVSAQSIGLAQGCLDEAIKYSKERVQFGKPICKNQAIAFMLADMATKLTAAKELVYMAAQMKDRNDPNASMYCSMAKYFASETCNEIAAKAVQIHGGYGYIKEYPVERKYRDCRVFTIYEGTSQVQQMVISGNLLK